MWSMGDLKMTWRLDIMFMIVISNSRMNFRKVFYTLMEMNVFKVCLLNGFEIKKSAL